MNNTSAGCSKCGGLVACWCPRPVEWTGIDYEWQQFSGPWSAFWYTRIVWQLLRVWRGMRGTP